MKNKKDENYKTWMFYLDNRLHPIWAGTGKTRKDAFEIMCLIHKRKIPYNKRIKSELL